MKKQRRKALPYLKMNAKIRIVPENLYWRVLRKKTLEITRKLLQQDKTLKARTSRNIRTLKRISRA